MGGALISSAEIRTDETNLKTFREIIESKGYLFVTDIRQSSPICYSAKLIRGRRNNWVKFYSFANHCLFERWAPYLREKIADLDGELAVEDDPKEKERMMLEYKGYYDIGCKQIKANMQRIIKGTTQIREGLLIKIEEQIVTDDFMILILEHCPLLTLHDILSRDVNKGITNSDLFYKIMTLLLGKLMELNGYTVHQNLTPKNIFVDEANKTIRLSPIGVDMNYKSLKMVPIEFMRTNEFKYQEDRLIKDGVNNFGPENDIFSVCMIGIDMLVGINKNIFNTGKVTNFVKGQLIPLPNDEKRTKYLDKFIHHLSIEKRVDAKTLCDKIDKVNQDSGSSTTPTGQSTQPSTAP